MRGKERENKKLTVERIKTFIGCEHYSEEEAKEIIDSIDRFSVLFVKFILDQKK